MQNDMRKESSFCFQAHELTSLISAVALTDNCSRRQNMHLVPLQGHGRLNVAVLHWRWCLKFLQASKYLSGYI